MQARPVSIAGICLSWAEAECEAYAYVWLKAFWRQTDAGLYACAEAAVLLCGRRNGDRCDRPCEDKAVQTRAPAADIGAIAFADVLATFDGYFHNNAVGGHCVGRVKVRHGHRDFDALCLHTVDILRLDDPYGVVYKLYCGHGHCLRLFMLASGIPACDKSDSEA